MNVKTIFPKFSKLKSELDWNLLLFLVLFLNVKLAVKIAAIILIYLSRFNIRFGFSLKNSRLPLFYPIIIAIALFDFAIDINSFKPNYFIEFLTGLGFWLLCILAAHQIKLSVERNDAAVINRTIIAFFLINAAVSLFNIASIIHETGAINPYTYQGQNQKYFLGTGDYIRGVTFDTSTTNAVLNAFGVIYFLTKKNAAMQFTCMVILLLTCSNYLNIVLIFVLLSLFIFKSNRVQKSLIVVCVMFFVVFMIKISPQNADYVVTSVNNILHKKNQPTFQQVNVPISIIDRPDSILSFDERREKIATLYLDSLSKELSKKITKTVAAKNISGVMRTDAGRILVPKPDINSAPYQSLVTTPPEQLTLVDFINTHQASLPISGGVYHWPSVPGKVTGMLQTVNFFRHHPGKIITGDGMGNFSSKLAFRASGLGFSGGFPAKLTYINPDFLVNHLDLYLNFFSKRAGLHSFANSPFSVFDQLFAEYGLVGFLAFCICYIGFFARHWPALTYGLPILFLTISILFIDYWFEQLSVLVFFELILFLDIKESAALQNK